MPYKTKILSLLLLGLLILPVMLSPQKTGNVLGVIENKSNTGNVASEIGEIGGGTMEVKTVSPSANTNSVLKGRAVWDGNAKSPVSSDKFNLGSSVKVVSNNQTLNLVVGDVRALSPDTLMVLDRATFVKLGGDPDSDKPLEVQVTLD